MRITKKYVRELKKKRDKLDKAIKKAKSKLIKLDAELMAAQDSAFEYHERKYESLFSYDNPFSCHEYYE